MEIVLQLGILNKRVLHCLEIVKMGFIMNQLSLINCLIFQTISFMEQDLIDINFSV